MFSSSDLTAYLKSPFAFWMENSALANPDLLSFIDKEDPMMSLLQKKGEVHENTILSSLQKEGIEVVDLSKSSGSVSDTVTAMRAGKDIIYQAELVLPPFKGRADFLVKVKGSSLLGDFHYEVWDTKLAKVIKPDFLVQLCCYVEMLESVQGRKPDKFAIILGNQEKHFFRCANFLYYYKKVKESFLEAQQNFNPQKHPD